MFFVSLKNTKHFPSLLHNMKTSSPLRLCSCYAQTSMCWNSWTAGGVKSVNSHHALHCEHPSVNDWLPFCPLRLSAILTFHYPAELDWNLSAGMCAAPLCGLGVCSNIYASHVSLFWHLGTYIKWFLTFQCCFEKKVHSCPFFVVWGILYLFLFIVTWHLDVLVLRGQVIRALRCLVWMSEGFYSYSTL